MKKLKTVLAVLMAASLTACGSSSAASTSTSASNASSSNAASTSDAAAAVSKDDMRIAYFVSALGDRSFGDSAERGMQELRDEGLDCKTIETTEASDKFNDYIYDAIDQGYNYMVASSTYYDNFVQIAKEYPDVHFVEFDDTHTPEELPDNMACILYAQNEASYLVGLMAAGTSKTGVVAVDVGIENPVINDFVTGYANAIKDWNAEHGTNVKMVKAAVGSWSDPTKMKQIVLDQARNTKADVFYQVAGGSGDGLFEACGETNTIAIGVDSDQYALYKDSENPEKADVIATSALKEVGNSLVAFFHQIQNGEDVWKKTTTLGLKDDSVGYVDNEHFEEVVPEDVRNEMAEAANKIKSGDLVVKSYFDFDNESDYEAYIADISVNQ